MNKWEMLLLKAGVGEGQEGSPWNIVLSSEPTLLLGLFSLHSSL